MEGFGRFLTRVAITIAGLATVLLVFVVEPVTTSSAKRPSAMSSSSSSVLLVDRGRRVRVGDLAVCTQKGQTLVARVTASAGQRLSLRGNLLFIDGEPVERRSCRKGDPAEADAPPGRCFVERRGDRSWTVIAPPAGRSVDLETSVPAGSVYLLNDERAAHQTDSRGIGPIARGACRSVAAEVALGRIRLRP